MEENGVVKSVWDFVSMEFRKVQGTQMTTQSLDAHFDGWHKDSVSAEGHPNVEDSIQTHVQL